MTSLSSHWLAISTSLCSRQYKWARTFACIFVWTFKTSVCARLLIRELSLPNLVYDAHTRTTNRSTGCSSAMFSCRLGIPPTWWRWWYCRVAVSHHKGFEGALLTVEQRSVREQLRLRRHSERERVGNTNRGEWEIKQDKCALFGSRLSYDPPLGVGNSSSAIESREVWGGWV